jgi:predicted dehydrogenase
LKVIQVGLGAFGFSWFKDVIMPSADVQLIALVDRDEAKLTRFREVRGAENIPYFSHINEALAVLKPDLVINLTPPQFHREVNRQALFAGIPVLCEKPIAESYADALATERDAIESGIPLIIAENYRYSPLIRRAKQTLQSGVIGELLGIDIAFRQLHPPIANYHSQMKHPLLMDVSIHHLDMLRYLTNMEAASVQGRTWIAEGSWYQGYSNAELFIRMADGLNVVYKGSLDSHDQLTDWNGHWIFKGSQGDMHILEDRLVVESNGEKLMQLDFPKVDSRREVLLESIRSIQDKRRCETDLADNIKTFDLTYAAIRSSETGVAAQLTDGRLEREIAHE